MPADSCIPADMQSLCLLLNISDNIAYRCHIFQFLGRNGHTIFLFKCHYQFKQIQGVYFQILLETGCLCDFYINMFLLSLCISLLCF